MIKILIADDHPVVRIGIKQILAEMPEATVSGEAASGSEVMDRIKKQDFDIILLDISMPGNGLDILKEIKAMRPWQKVLVLSIYPEQQYAVRALKAGASGYLTKDSAPDELITAIKKVSLGGKYASVSLAEKLVSDLEPGARGDAHEHLSDREYQVLCLVAQGKSSKAISQEMNLSPKTISTYRARIMQKLGLKNATELICYAVENKICL